MLTVTLGPTAGERSGPALSPITAAASLSMRALVAMPSTHTHRKLRGFAGLQALTCARSAFIKERAL